ncbi:MAG TPA: PA14 domain-containing protein [Polyangia bacterium]
MLSSLHTLVDGSALLRLAALALVTATPACLDVGRPQSVNRLVGATDAGGDASGDVNSERPDPGDGAMTARDGAAFDAPANPDVISTGDTMTGGGVRDAEPPRDVSPGVTPDRPPATQPAGMPCTSATDCTSGFCTDGVCCDSACAGLCQTCADPEARGVCRPAKAGSDPRNQCADEGAASCGRDGSCDGARACRRYAADTVCAPATCAAGMVMAASRCDAAGVCQKGAAMACAPYGCGTDPAVRCKTTCQTKADCSGLAECFAGVCGGLQGVYFASLNFTGRSVTRIDRNVDFNFGNGAPEPTMPTDMYSIRWTGKVTAPADGAYTFFTESDDGVVLWVNDQMIINRWQIQSVATASGQVMLKAGTPTNIKLEYFDDHGEGIVRLSWSGPSLARQIVPVSALTP